MSPSHMRDARTRDRFLGSLLGLATGDAVGTALEFRRPGSFAPIDDMAGGGPFGLEPGQWTDDTSMALCLATSLLEKGEFDAVDQMGRYLRWYHEGYLSSTGRCFDVGNTVRSALHRYEQSGEPYSGATDRFSAGNGSIMRLAPVVLFYAGEPELAISRAVDSSRTTHAAAAAVDACRYLAALLLGALAGESRERLLQPHYTPVPGLWQRQPLVAEIDEIAAGSFWQKAPPLIRGTGYVVESLEAALWAFAHGDDFREGCLLAANLGDDADTTAAVYGQLAGATYGARSIPAPWLDRLARREEIEALAVGLWRAASSR